LATDRAGVGQDAAMATEPRLVIVSNRLPVTVTLREGVPELTRSAGGLATGLSGPHERSNGLWIGWPGDLTALSPTQKDRVLAELEQMRVVPVQLSRDQVRRYYDSYSNGVLWPLFHYLVESVPLTAPDWDAYVQVNQKFADAVAARCTENDLIWVHDYQLMLVPGMLRRRLPRARIGFFLHIPFPSSEILRTLVRRSAILEGLLGADLIGFHTASYLRHFASSALRLLGAGSEIDRLSWEGRSVRLGVFPMGIDAASFAALGDDPAVQAEVRTLRAGDEARWLVGIDRLDYTKGIPRRLLAYEKLLADHPELHKRVVLVQVAVPSRQDVEAYERLGRQVDRLVGRINGRFGTPRWTPVRYMVRALPLEEIVSLYRLADVMVVTPVRDGMNLVAKEFVAARTDRGGVLIISELAGAAAELAEALHVNPYDIDRTAEAMHRALLMPAKERAVRMDGLRRRVLTHDVRRWVSSFLEALVDAAREAHVESAVAPSPPAVLDEALERAASADDLVLLIDYDGTLVSFAQTPDLAMPDPGVLELLGDLAACRATSAHVVSGRSREVLERWLGELPIGLHAEHGLWSRPAGGEWSQLEIPPTPWRDKVRAILELFAARTPGSIVEEKAVALAWHYRAADTEFGQRQANELRLHLTELLSNVPVELLTGSKVIEVRPHGMNKGRVVSELLAAAPAGALLVALGDDRTDEDMFAALPPGALALHVGPERSAAPLRLGNPGDARSWLGRLAARRARSGQP
jgi:trehalose 6-phosphate synthase/phosphatase